MYYIHRACYMQCIQGGGELVLGSTVPLCAEYCRGCGMTHREEGELGVVLFLSEFLVTCSGLPILILSECLRSMKTRPECTW